MMAATLELESTLTDRYQTTVPDAVRRVLKLGKRDKVHYSVREDGLVILSRATEAEQDDPVLNSFLGFLAQDMQQNPERLQAMSSALQARILSLTASIDVDLDAPLSEEDE